MPNPIPVLQVALNGGAPARGGVAAVAGNVVRFSLASTADVRTARYYIDSAPTGVSVPAGWSTDTKTGRFYYDAAAGVHAPDITLPSNWGKWTARVELNGDGTAVDTWAGVEIVSPNLGLHDLAYLEGGAFSGSGTMTIDQYRSWVAAHRANLRALDNAGAGAPNTWSVGDKALWYGQADLATAAACGDYAGDVTTGYKFRVMRAATCSGVRAFVHWGGGGTKSVKCSLWDCSGTPARLDSKTLSALSSDSLHDFIFPATRALTTDRAYMVTAWITDGSYETRWIESFAVPPTAPFFAGPNVLVIDAGMNVAGDALPDSPGSPVPLQPLFA